MRRIFTLALLFICFLLSLTLHTRAQSCIKTNINGTVVNLTCGQTCTDLTFKIPHLKSTDDYIVNAIPYQPYNWTTAGGTALTSIYIDDQYSDSIALGFPFCFFGKTYSKCVIGSNGILTFDVVSNANQENAFILQAGGTPIPIPYAGGSPGSATPAYYPRASIMGAYHDIDPNNSSTSQPADRKMEYRIEGTAPCRTFIASFYHVPYYNCPDSIVSQQIAIHENTGLIEVFFETKPFACSVSTNDGLAILGLQNWDQNKQVSVPGRNCTEWRAVNEGWRFTPSGGTSKFVSAELLTIGGAVIGNADTLTTTPGVLDLSFLNFCPTGPSGTKFVVRTTFAGCIAGVTLISLDTITISRVNALTASSSATPTTCGSNTGTITATVTPGEGTAPFTYILNPGAVTNSTGIFTGLSTGPYTISISDLNGCPVTIRDTVTAISSLPSNIVKTNTGCPGVNNGTITITPTAGTAPYTYSLNGGTGQASNIFINLAPGTYTVTFTDANGCAGTPSTVTILAGTALTSTALTVGSACPGASNGSVTITPTSGAAPYQYSIDGGASQASNIFAGLAAGSHTVTITDASGCTGTKTFFITSGAGIDADGTTTSTSCPGINDGTATITPNNGTAPYTYSADGGPFQASNVLTGLSPTFHTITVQDANNCTGSVTLVITTGFGISATASFTASSCPGATNGTITVTPTSGAAPYTYSLDGGTFQASNIFNAVASGAHTVAFKDANGCTGTVSVTVTTGAAITGTASSTAAACPGATNGTITVTPTSGNSPYTFSLNGGTPQASNTFTGLPAGTYTVTIADASTCTGTVSISVTSGAAITGTASSTATSCPGVNNGTITVTPSSGSAPYSYDLDGGTPQASNIFNSVTAGPHIIIIRDANGCTLTVNLSVSAGAGINGTASSTATSCPGVNNGTITVTPSSGSAPYGFALDGGSFQASNIFNSVTGGSHIITIRDANGCTGTVNISVITGAAITGTGSSTATSCPGVNNGTVTVTPATGTAPYTYSIDGGASQPGNIFTALAAGPHVVTFQDANGCTGTKNVNVVGGTGLTGTTTTTTTSCPAVSNGSVTVTATSGTAPYTYSSNGGTTFQVSNTFTGLASGPIAITIRDVNGCTGIVSATVAQGASITGTAVATGTSCPGVNNGTITVTPITGTAPYIYSIDGGVSQSGNIFTGLAPGVHTITFQDAIGCARTVNSTVAAGTGLSSTQVIEGTSCPGINNGTITVTPTSGTAPYQYILDGGTPQGSNVFSGLTAGNHSITFTDALGCIGTVNRTVPAGVGLISSLSVLNPPCANINDGTLTITPSTGIAPYQYSLNGGAAQPGNVFSGLTPGISYTITFTDAIGCTGTKSATLTTNTPITSTITKTMPLCNGNTNGSLRLNPSGGVPPYQYSINAGGTYQAGNTFSGLSAGTYTFRIRDNVGCIEDTTVILNQPPLLIASATSTAGTCTGNDGLITVSRSGGTSPYQYSINNGITYQAGNTFIVSGGLYPNIRVKDAKGCVANTNVNVTLIDNMIPLNLGPDSTICVGSSVTFNPQTNAETNVFLWTSDNLTTPIPAGAIDNDTIKNATVTPTDTFAYVLTAQWGVCSRKDTIVINVLHKPIANAGPDSAICFDQSIAILQGSADNASGPALFSWTDTTGIQNPDTSYTFVTLNATTTYTLTVTDNYGCNFSTTDQVKIAVQSPVPAYAGNDTIAIRMSPHQLMATGGTDYSWTPTYPFTGSSPYIANPLAILDHDQQFVVLVADSAGCKGYDTVFIKVFDGPDYYVPNAFSPNGDGLNDVFRVIPAGITRTDYFRIFNRYGQMIFETNQWLKGWDGTFQGKRQPAGTYVWILKGINKFGKVIEKQGTVLIVQ